MLYVRRQARNTTLMFIPRLHMYTLFDCYVWVYWYKKYPITRMHANHEQI